MPKSGPLQNNGGWHIDVLPRLCGCYMLSFPDGSELFMEIIGQVQTTKSGHYRNLTHWPSKYHLHLFNVFQN